VASVEKDENVLLVSQVLEGCAAVQGPSVTLNGSFCAQVEARRIIALDGERASASGGASQDLRLKDKVVDGSARVGGMRGREGLIAMLNGSFYAQVEGTADHRAGRRSGQRSRQCFSRHELQLI